MGKAIVFAFFCTLALRGYSQTEINLDKTISISVPVITNYSEATYYSLGNPKYPSGKATSYGLNVNHSRPVFRNLNAILGVGYFKQTFGIQRPFEYKTPDGSKPLVRTRNYIYHSYHFLLGISYHKKLNEVVSIKGTASFNLYTSFRQKYNPKDFFVDHSQINHKSIALGNAVNLTIGPEWKLTERISAGVDLLLPILTNWNNDEMFFKYEYSNDSQQIARDKFSFGIAISCNYKF